MNSIPFFPAGEDLKTVVDDRNAATNTPGVPRKASQIRWSRLLGSPAFILQPVGLDSSLHSHLLSKLLKYSVFGGNWSEAFG